LTAAGWTRGTPRLSQPGTPAAVQDAFSSIRQRARAGWPRCHLLAFRCISAHLLAGGTPMVHQVSGNHVNGQHLEPRHLLVTQGDTCAVVIASCLRPSHKLFSTHAAEIGTAAIAIPVMPRPRKDNSPYDQAPI